MKVQVSHYIYGKSYHEEDEAYREKREVMFAAAHGLAHLGGYCRRKRPHRLEYAFGYDGGITGYHHDRHSLSDDSADAKHHRGDYAGGGRRDHYPVYSLDRK